MIGPAYGISCHFVSRSLMNAACVASSAAVIGSPYSVPQIFFAASPLASMS
jgi:hypothetical protein